MKVKREMADVRREVRKIRDCNCKMKNLFSAIMFRVSHLTSAVSRKIHFNLFDQLNPRSKKSLSVGKEFHFSTKILIRNRYNFKNFLCMIQKI